MFLWPFLMAKKPCTNWAPSPSSPQVMQCLTTSCQMKPSSWGKCNLRHDKSGKVYCILLHTAAMMIQCVINWYQLNLFALFCWYFFLPVLLPFFPVLLLSFLSLVVCLCRCLYLACLIVCLFRYFVCLLAHLLAGMLVCVLVNMLVTLACLLSWLTYFVEAR